MSRQSLATRWVAIRRLLATAVFLTVFGAAAVAGAGPSRQVQLVDERGNEVDFLVVVEGGSSEIQKCKLGTQKNKAYCKAEFVLRVNAGPKARDLYGAVKRNKSSRAVTLVAHPQASRPCFDVNLERRKDARTSLFFAPSKDDAQEVRLCGSDTLRYTAHRREARLRLEIPGAAAIGSFDVRSEQGSARPTPDAREREAMQAQPAQSAQQNQMVQQVQMVTPKQSVEPGAAQVVAGTAQRADGEFRRTDGVVDLMFRFEKPPTDPEEVLRLELEAHGYHGIPVAISRAQLMRSGAAFELTTTEPVPIFQRVRMRLPPAGGAFAPPADSLFACVQYPVAADEDLIEQAAAATKPPETPEDKPEPHEKAVPEDSQRDTCDAFAACQTDDDASPRCLPCMELSQTGNVLRTQCPLWAEVGDNRLLVRETKTKAVYSDAVECFLDDGGCEAQSFFRTPKNTIVPLEFDQETLTKLDAGNRATLVVDRILPSGSTETLRVELRGSDEEDPTQESITRPDAVYVDFNGQIDPEGTRYNLRLYAAYSNHSRERRALPLATEIDRATLYTAKHDATGLRYSKFGVSMAAYSGPSLVVPGRKVRDAIEAETGERRPYSHGSDPFVGLRVIPEWYLGKQSLPLQLVLGVQAEPVRTWTYGALAAPRSDPRWRSRALVGLGLRFRPVPWTLKASAEVQVAWAPEFVGRGQDVAWAEQLGVGMVSGRLAYDLLPQFLDRLKAFAGVDWLIGSRTNFVFDDTEVSRKAIHRIHVAFGLALNFDVR